MRCRARISRRESCGDLRNGTGVDIKGVLMSDGRVRAEKVTLKRMRRRQADRMMMLKARGAVLVAGADAGACVLLAGVGADDGQRRCRIPGHEPGGPDRRHRRRSCRRRSRAGHDLPRPAGESHVCTARHLIEWIPLSAQSAAWDGRARDRELRTIFRRTRADARTGARLVRHVGHQRGFDELDGQNLRDGTLVTVARQFRDEPAPFDTESLTLQIRSSTMTVFGSVGVTNRLEVGAAVPFARVSVEGQRINVYRGSTFLQASATGTASGIADVAVRAKYTLLARPERRRRRSNRSAAANRRCGQPARDRHDLLPVHRHRLARAGDVRAARQRVVPARAASRRNGRLPARRRWPSARA